MKRRVAFAGALVVAVLLITGGVVGVVVFGLRAAVTHSDGGSPLHASAGVLTVVSALVGGAGVGLWGLLRDSP